MYYTLFLLYQNSNNIPDCTPRGICKGNTVFVRVSYISKMSGVHFALLCILLKMFCKSTKSYYVPPSVGQKDSRRVVIAMPFNALLDAKEQANVTDWSNITLIDKWKSEFSWSYGSCRDKLYPSTE